MSTIVTRSGKGVALTWSEVDSNFTNLNTDKYQEGSAIGATTPAAGTFTTLTANSTFQAGKGSANYQQEVGAATGLAPIHSVAGSDTNISQVFQSKGTGAIDLAAGSSGVNISNGGTVTAITRTNNGTGYTSAPTVAITAPTTAGGVQATATATVSAGSLTGITITNAGSGYVEQPTVSFSGGGGSGAAAYARVGSDVAIKGLGTNINFQTPQGSNALQIRDSGVAAPVFLSFQSSSSNSQIYTSGGTGGNAGNQWFTLGTGSHQFGTNSGTVQFNVSHTASAVNYVQVTGAATGGRPTISAQGSDSAINMQYDSKSTGYHVFRTNGVFQFVVLNTTGAVNYTRATGSLTGAAPAFSVEGSDTNIDLALTPKGTGLVRFGTYTAGAPAATGYISIKAADGTTYKVLVGT